MAKEITYLEAIREALFEEMRRDPKVFVLGEDVGAYGGAFGVTAGLVDEFGEARCLDMPISESAIVGVSIGASQRGYRPVAEMQFADFISCGFNQIVNNLATTHYRWGAPVHVTIRAPFGGSIGAGPFHSQSPEAWFCHTPGLKVVVPSTPEDAKGLLISSISEPNASDRSRSTRARSCSRCRSRFRRLRQTCRALPSMFAGRPECRSTLLPGPWVRSPGVGLQSWS